jgi:hypothetical protein
MVRSPERREPERLEQVQGGAVQGGVTRGEAAFGGTAGTTTAGGVVGGEAASGGVGLLLGDAEMVDLGALCARVLRLDPNGLLRVRMVAERVTVYSMLPLDVLASLTVRSPQPGVGDRTVSAADLLGAIESATSGARGAGPAGGAEPGRSARVLALSATAARDAAWRGTLPPAAGWSRLDLVPVTAVAAAVRAGRAAFEPARGRPDAAAIGGTLLDHQALQVCDGERAVTLPLRVLYAAWRMGFLGVDPAGSAGHCAVSMAGGWTRLAAPHGSVYHQRRLGLAVTPG